MHFSPAHTESSSLVKIKQQPYQKGINCCNASIIVQDTLLTAQHCAGFVQHTQSFVQYSSSTVQNTLHSVHNCLCAVQNSLISAENTPISAENTLVSAKNSPVFAPIHYLNYSFSIFIY